MITIIPRKKFKMRAKVVIDIFNPYGKQQKKRSAWGKFKIKF